LDLLQSNQANVAVNALPQERGSRIVDQLHQIAHRPASFQPIVFAGVPLHQLTECAAPCAPTVHILHLAPAALPQAGLDHPPAQSLVAHLDAVSFGQLLAGKPRSEVMPIRLLQKRHGLRLSSRCNLTVGGASPGAVHHHPVAFPFHPLQQLSHPALTHAHPFGNLALGHLLVARSLQPIQPVSFLLAHLDSFHPSALRLSIGTFYFGQLGTFHFGATEILEAA
jgi:hypothetical protein